MPETTTLNLGGAQLTVDTNELFRAWFERHLAKPIAQTAIPLARPGERYLGSIIEPDGRVRHTYLMAGEAEKSWSDGMEWAKSLGGDLPDRIEQAMLLAFMPDEFQKKAYWSNTQHAGDSNFAWSQYFDYGDQDDFYKSAELLVRAVRRVFSDSVI